MFHLPCLAFGCAVEFECVPAGLRAPNSKFDDLEVFELDVRVFDVDVSLGVFNQNVVFNSTLCIQPKCSLQFDSSCIQPKCTPQFDSSSIQPKCVFNSTLCIQPKCSLQFDSSCIQPNCTPQFDSSSIQPKCLQFDSLVFNQNVVLIRFLLYSTKLYSSIRLL
ncbi:hypothetical protein CDAR_181821 [Caerostris darwini]|uniref:Uncharacterized protein n=1 Tax=Caerostris darwini TaxID=1538125 RepID=A0AAV4PWC4_9ARAC|nr:hypothetical protein CDAR_181821 [Caerostris darwini]